MFFMFLEVRQLDVHYPGRAQAAVRGASFGLRAGEIGVLIGPSGCGKTTLLRAVAGLEPVSAGEIRLGGELVSHSGSTLAPELRRIGMVFQDYEPFSNLDVDLRERLAHEVRAILKAAQATALFVTHDQLEAFAIGDAIGVMHEGQLHQWDDAYTLYHRPATRFVANFIGHGVFTPATLREVNQQVMVKTALGELSDVAECPLPCAYAQGECDVLLRADDIVHDDEAPVKAEIIRKAFRGSEFLYTLRLASGETVLAHVPSHHNHTVGEWIGIRAEVDHVVTFNRACPPGKGGMCELPCAAACSEPCGDPAKADGEHAVTLVRGAAARAPSTVGAAD